MKDITGKSYMLITYESNLWQNSKEKVIILSMFSLKKKKQLTQWNAQQQHTFMMCIVHVQRHDMPTVLLHCSIANTMRTLSY